MSLRGVRRAYGLSEAIINAIVREAGVKSRGAEKLSEPWSEDQDAILKERYADCDTYLLSSELGKTRKALIGRAHRLGLKHNLGKRSGVLIRNIRRRLAENLENKFRRRLEGKHDNYAE
jgi:hypothetical protein